MSRTFREIEYRLYYIDRRLKIEQSNKIALAGGKPKIAIPKRKVSSSKVEVSKEDQELDEKIKKAIAKRQEQWQKN